MGAGDRKNVGLPGRRGDFQPSGVYVGLVGARFERQKLMESRFMLVTPSQNVPGKGYGPPGGPGWVVDPILSLWAEFYAQVWLCV